MVNTRSTVRKQKLEEENKQLLLEGNSQPAKEEKVDEEEVQDKQLKIRKRLFHRLDTAEAGSSLKSNGQQPSSARSSTTLKSKKSSSSSIIARKKRLELEATEAKARIQMELIDKRLQADMAALEEEEYSSHSEGEDEVHTNGEVERWLESSLQKPQSQLDLQQGKDKDEMCPPATTSAGTDGTVHMLATALRDLAATSLGNVPNSNMLSRICTPRDLPSFSGDPMEWLQFKQAFEESTQVCSFTNKENLWRLRKSLHGEAKEAVTALLISATSPDVVMSTLELQFGNPDIIITRITQEVMKLPVMSPDYHKDIVKFSVKVKNYVAAILAIGQEEYLQNMNVTSVVLSKLPTVLLSKWTDYSYPLINDRSKSKLVILSDFLSEEATKITKTAVNINYSWRDRNYNKQKYPAYNINRSHNVLLQAEVNPDLIKCRFCHASKHKLTECTKFKKALRKDRWRHVKRYGLCYKCLLSRHDRNTCPAPLCNKNNCGQSHHPLLHYNINTQTTPQEPHIETESVSHVKGNNCKILLKIVRITVHGPKGDVTTCALLDDGSTVSLICSELASRVGLTGNKKTMRVCGAFDNNLLVCDSEIVDLTVSNREGTLFTFKANSVNELNLPAQDMSNIYLSKYKHLSGIENQLNLEYCKPQILIGQDNYDLLLPLQINKGKPHEPYATLTSLGWCLHGSAEPPTTARILHSQLLLISHTNEESIQSEYLLREIQEEVRRSFTIDSLGITCKPRLNADDVRAETYLEKSARLIEGRWIVGLPWKNINCQMPSSFHYAMTRLKGVERKMKIYKEFALRYKDRIDHLLDNNYAKELTDTSEKPRTWYLPHFGVDNPNKKKLRLVFDAAAKTKGFCLNDYLLKGPDLLNSLLGIMMRFRERRIGITGDIKDMFLRIKIIPEDQDALRFIWRNDRNELKTYAMTSLIFGANCSPFIAQFIKNKNAKIFESSKPSAALAISHQHYCDDYIDSVDTIENAKQLINDISYIHKQGGFEIRNWTSNSQEVLNCMPKETLGPSSVRFKIGQESVSERILGLIWFPDEDTLGFDVSFKRIPKEIISGDQKPTKREMLKVIMSIFDVFGFLAPFTIKGKIILQQTWQTGIDWDDVISNELYCKWKEWLYFLNSVNQIRIPRHYDAFNGASETENAPNALNNSARALRSGGYMNLELHIFCDASTKAMCAVGYWRWNNNGIRTAFISSKCRVAPVKHISVPRLELQAAVLGARLATTIVTEHKIKPQKKYYWSDSSTVLCWIRNNVRNYKTFVAHRLGEIDELTCANEWHYVPTKMNVADVATREDFNMAIFNNIWFHGPDFLRCDDSEWPKELERNVVLKHELEIVTNIKCSALCLPACPDPERFSSWLRLLKSMCVILSFINKLRRKLNVYIDSGMMIKAEQLLTRYAQIQSFPEELENLEQKRSLARKSKLLTLSPFLDEHGILRVGGRINAAPEVGIEVKQPVILDGRHHIAKLIVMHYIKKYAHGNQETVVNELKQNYWIIRIRPTVKNVISRCMLCRIRTAQPHTPRMGDLPAARMAHHQRPFTFCGLDLFGPMEVTIGRRREKRYGVLFTCMTVRAIHIEIVSTLSSDSLIMALRRMASRRGWPQQLFSDNGTNLRGANTELKKSVEDLNQDVLRREAVNYGTTWNFIPPSSPHWGGAWERLIRSVKTSLKVILTERAPREEVLCTLMAEVEQIVNSRPLTHVSVDPESNETLTPNHFLLGSSSTLPILGSYNESDMFLRKQWRISQVLADCFWRRWVREILPDMLPRRKWCEDQKPLQVGDLVIIVDPNMPRNVWPRGVIQAVYPGKDGRVRVVDIRTKTGTLRRPAARVAKIPTGAEC